MGGDTLQARDTAGVVAGGVTCAWWRCRHPLARHTLARGCTVEGCLCHYIAQDQPTEGLILAAVAWRNLYAVASRSGRLLVPIEEQGHPLGHATMG